MYGYIIVLCARVGAFGVDFSTDVDKIREGVIKVAGGVLRHGVTAFCPTIVTSPSESYKKVKVIGLFFPIQL